MASPLVLQNGIYMRSTEFNMQSHIDAAHVTSVNAGKEEITNLGIIKPFITTGYMGLSNTIRFGEGGVNRIFSNGHIYSMSQPLTAREFYVLELITKRDQLGRGGEEFQVKFNTRRFDNLWVITPDPNTGLDFLITTKEIVKDGDGWIYTLVIDGVNAADRSVEAIYFQPGSKFFGKYTYDAEYNQTYSSLPDVEGGMREYFNFVGQTSSQIHYSVTREAAVMPVSTQTVHLLDKYREIVEIMEFAPGTLGYNVSNASPEIKRALNNNPLNMYVEKYGKNAEKRFVDDLVGTAWVPAVEALAIATLQKMVHTMAWYGTGGKVQIDGKTQGNNPLGMWFQLAMGNRHIMNPYDFSLQTFEAIVTSRLVDRQEPYKNEKVFTVRTGRGGYANATHQISKLPAQLGVLMDASSTNFVQGFGGDNAHLKVATPTYDMYRMRNGYGWLKFEIDPALDPVVANDITNPVLPYTNQIGGSRLSSYIYIIEDLMGAYQSDNVCEIVYKHDWDIRGSVNQGNLAYMGAPTFKGGMWQRSSNHPGFEVIFQQRHKAYVIKDTTRALTIVPLNPFTNKPIFSTLFG